MFALDRRYTQLFICLCMGLMGLICFIGLVGHIFDVHSMIQLFPSWTPLKLSLIVSCLGISLAYISFSFKKLWPTRIGLLVTTMIGFVTLAQYIFNIGLWTDRLDLLGKAPHFAGPYPGRMSLSLTIAVLLSILALARSLWRNQMKSAAIAGPISASLLAPIIYISFTEIVFDLDNILGYADYSQFLHPFSLFIVLMALSMLALAIGETNKKYQWRVVGLPFIVSLFVLSPLLYGWGGIIRAAKIRSEESLRVNANYVEKTLVDNISSIKREFELVTAKWSPRDKEMRKDWQQAINSLRNVFPEISCAFVINQDGVLEETYPITSNTRAFIRTPFSMEKIRKAGFDHAMKGMVHLTPLIRTRIGTMAIQIWLPANHGGRKYAHFIAIDMTHLMSSRLSFPSYRIELQGEDLSIAHNARDARIDSDSSIYSFNMLLGGRSYLLRLLPTPETVKLGDKKVYWFFLISGWGLGVLLGVVIHSWQVTTILSQNLQRGRKELDDILSGLPLGVFKGDITGRIYYSNQALQNITGIDSFENANDAWKLRVHREDKAMLVELQQKILSESASFNAQFRIVVKRQIKWIKVQTNPIFDGKNLVGFIGTVEDETRRHVAEQAAEEHKFKLVASSRMAAIGEMAASIAHEINNPVAIIQGKSFQLKHMIAEGAGPADMERELQRIEQTTQRIAKIVRGLRTFSRDGDDDPKLPTSLKSILDDAFELIRARISNYNIKLEFPTDLPASLILDCRSVQIGQIIFNLVSNAFDAVQTAANKHIAVKVEEDHSYVSIVVEDWGAGISEELEQKIFDPFMTTKLAGKGTGLGLSISRRLAEAHDGQLILAQRSGPTRFILRLPKSHNA